MESGSAVVGRDEKRKKYHIYVEEYVLSYLRREADSLELSEIYFYGSRKENGRKLYVYGAGRDKEIVAFAGYEPLSELVCRLTQAGPVFLVREPDGECRVTGFQVFYDNNEAMQNYLLEWTGSAGRKQNAEKSGLPEKQSVSAAFPDEEKKRTPHRAMSVQLCLILVVLVAIVITSTDSYDKMEELNRSAKEVFFAIENQEAGDRVPETDSQSKNIVSGEISDDYARNADVNEADMAKEKEIVIERETEPFADTNPEEEKESGEPVQTSDSDEPTGDQVQAADSETEEDTGIDGADDSDTEEMAEESVLKSVQESSGQTDEQKETEEGEEENEEALSRSITRYYEVEQGDTLYTISQKIYGDISRVEKICEVNQIIDPDKIHSGQRIILP